MSAGPLHLNDADTVLNSAASMGTSGFNCVVGVGRDVETVALHELGHWVHLGETFTDPDAVMYARYQECRRSLDGHDVYSVQEMHNATEICPFHPCNP